MKPPTSFSIGKGSASVTLVEGRVVVCKLSGTITGPLVQESMRRTKVLSREAYKGGQQPSLIIDAKEITSHDSAARSLAKELNKYNFERIAVYGTNRAILAVGKYIARIAGMGGYTRFFSKYSAAQRWAFDGYEKVYDELYLRRLIAVAAIVIIAGGALAGWALDIPILKSIIPALKPMNPAVAIFLLAATVAIGLFTPDWHKRLWKKIVIFAIAFCLVVFGLLVLLQSFLFIGHGLNPIVLNDQALSWSQAQASASGAIVAIAFGIMFGLLLTGQHKRWQKDAYFLLSGIIFLITIGTLVGYCFGLNSIATSYQFLPMALNTTIAVMFANFALSAMGVQTRMSRQGNGLFNAYWQALVVTLLLILATGVVWQQSKFELQRTVNTDSKELFNKVENSLNSRLSAYSDALVGFRALFAASTDVSPADFQNYFNSIKLAENYPGFSAITYVSSVPDDQKGQFIEETRARATEEFPKYAEFTIYPETSSTVYYPLTYVQPISPTTQYGFDLGTEDVRRQTLEAARDSDAIVASGIINLNASRGSSAPVNPGFFMSEPIYNNIEDFSAEKATVAERQEHIVGFVLAYFRNDRLFEDVLAFAKDDNAQYRLSSKQSGQDLYVTSAGQVDNQAPIIQTSTIQNAGQEWQLDMRVSSNFGKSQIFSKFPIAILIGGIGVSFLAGSLVLGQLRRRDQAFALAERMTEDLKNERNLAVENQQKDEAILSSIGDAVFAIDTHQRITLFNPVAEQISGWLAEEAIGKPYKEVLPFIAGEKDKINDQFIKKALSGHIASMRNHTSLIRRDGSRVAVADSAAPIRNAKGQIMGAIVVFRDVSKEYELDKAKTEFVSLASHQLRTPLSAINWYGEMLLNGDAGKLTKSQQEYIREIFEGNQRMIELVNSLLDVSRLELGKLTNIPQQTHLDEIVTDIQKELTTSIKTKKLHYKLAIDKVPPIFSDPKLLRMIVQNLCSNAVKYTADEGTVLVTLRTATDHDLQQTRLKGDDYLFFSVADNGFGIPKEQQSHIFSKLFRADNVRVLDVEGTGLGLYIVKQVVEKMGGQIWFDSVEKKGTTFSVVLPLKTQHNKK